MDSIESSTVSRCKRHGKSFAEKRLDISGAQLVPKIAHWDLPIEVKGLVSLVCLDCLREERDPEILDAEIVRDHIERLERLSKPIRTTPYRSMRVVLDYRVPDSSSEQPSNGENDFIPETPCYSFEDLVSNEHVLGALKRTISRIINHDLIFNTWGFSVNEKRNTGIAINLFGPPGTGKSMSAEVIASALSKKIVRVQYSQLESKYVGETSKNIVSAFESARTTNSLLLFDEADSILGKRLENLGSSADHAVNVARSTMLMQLERFSGVVVFTTNKFRNYDEAFLRRISEHVEIPLPSKDQRAVFLEKFIPQHMPQESLNFAALADSSEGLSGAEIKAVILTAISEFAEIFMLVPEAVFDGGYITRNLEAFKKAKLQSTGLIDLTETSKI